LIAQLASLKFEFNQQEKIKIESKADLRERLGIEASPDRADTLVIGCAPYYSFVEGQNSSVQSSDIYEGAERPNYNEGF
jgi:hypothetical protein